MGFISAEFMYIIIPLQTHINKSLSALSADSIDRVIFARCWGGAQECEVDDGDYGDLNKNRMVNFRAFKGALRIN